ncbi:MAG TPA: winged helix DNA-binding domain-containing protein [Ginsengibacter sp.]
MNFKNISNVRLIAQQITTPTFTTPKEIVSWMGALQAQDYNMAKWAIGVRLPGSTDAKIEDAFNKGTILRTHVLRPTWHFVSADDIQWMLELTAPHMNLAMKSRHKQLGLNEKIFSKSNSIIQKALEQGKHLTRPEIMSELEKANIATHDLKAIHLMYHAELNGIVCSGMMRGKNHTYALLEERVKKVKHITREEALAKLAERYFKSRCPATLEDFIWWSGLNITDGRNALEMVKNNFISENIKSKTYWLPGSFSVTPKSKSSFYLLPAFDEFIISYKDRRAVIEQEYYAKAFTANGIFRPVMVMNGKVIGLWKRDIQKDKLITEAQFFKRAGEAAINSFKNESKTYAKFLCKKVEVKI